MFNKHRLLAKLLLCIYFELFSQVSSSIDTIGSINDNRNIQLDNQFIIESTLVIKNNDGFIKPNKIDPIKGIIHLHDSTKVDGLIISYSYLSKPLPSVIGPKWKNLQTLNSVIVNAGENSVIEKEESRGLKLNPVGSMYRKISISPIGGSEFSGGMQMQFNGKLSNEINVSGIITDQDLPFQPDGTTLELDDLDEIYINIRHPKFMFDAGDIIFKYKDKYNNINRKLEGIKYNFNYDEYSGNSVYASSKGHFKSIDIKGRDGDQGPYILTGNDNNRDVVILSGTEKVWVNGVRMIRGDNYDYIIDYSRGEIIFTPRILVDFDTDITIEYQYSDFEYQMEFIGGNISNKLGKSLSINLGLFSETDKYDKENFDLDILDSLQNISNGSLKIATALQDSNGKYINDGEKYIYDPFASSEEYVLFDVSFYYDIDGEYQRKISDLGQIYYEYVSEIDRKSILDLFSPFKIINTPKSQQLLFCAGEYQLADRITIGGELSGSRYQNNIINNYNSINGGSYIISTAIDSMDLNFVRLNFSFKDWYRDKNYNSIEREDEILYTRLWNLDSIITTDIRESMIDADLIINSIGKSKVEIARLIHGDDTRSRVQFTQNLFNQKFQNSFVNYISVKSDSSNYHRLDSRIEVKTRNIAPFFSYLNEQKSFTKQFNKKGFGINLKGKKRKIETGIDYRKDQYYSLEENWVYDSDDIVGYANYILQESNGWKQDIIFKKRIKSNLNNKLLDYSLYDIRIGYKNFRKPIQFNIQAKKEESFSEKRATVYDSVGSGLGQYRYDANFNTYVFDPNGEYIAYNILTGNREQNTIFQAAQNFSWDLSTIFKSSDIKIMGHLKQEYRGQGAIIASFINHSIEDKDLFKLSTYSRLETIFSNSGRYLLWIENQSLLDGYDPRGNDFSSRMKTGLDISHKLWNNISLYIQSSIHEIFIESKASSLRNRSMVGIWNDLRLKIKLDNSLDFDVGILGGLDNGSHVNSKFSAKSYGLRGLWKLLFKKTGRFELETILLQTEEANNLLFLPPEAQNGYLIGTSFRANSQFQYFFNNSISIIFNLNMINDSRYNNLINVQGEIRANF